MENPNCIEINQSEKPKKNGKRLYWWGLLGFFPLVGAFAGIVLILRGIFEFKDRFLVIIGSASVLFTVCAYSFLFYVVRSGVGFLPIAQNNLNSLVTEIEFYKMQNGSYPDSLEQVIKDEYYTPICDPFLSTKLTKRKTNYHYQNFGSKYTILSVGRDGVPNTKDDIYPSLKIKDTSKCGLITPVRGGQ